MMIMGKKRNSNIELLRIVCMLYILLIHFVGLGIGLPHNLSDSTLSENFVLWFLENLGIVGLDCFVVITGYFSLQLSLKKILNLYLQLLFYSVTIEIIFILLGLKDIHWNDIIKLPFVFSLSNLWFTRIYFFLMLLSPILNKTFFNISKKAYLLILFIMAFIVFFNGYVVRNEANNNLITFMFLYLIGRGIYIFWNDFFFIRSKRKYFLILYLAITLLMTFQAILNNILGIEGHNSNGFNSPLVILSSIMFFYFFLSFSIYSKFVNTVASSTLAVYVIHMNPNLKPLLFDWINEYYDKSIFFYILGGIAIILFFSICILVDKVRIMLMTPIMKLVNSNKYIVHIDNFVRNEI